MTRNLLLSFACLFATTYAASAAVVVTIDISNPAAVVITGLPANSTTTGDLTVNFAGGISFLNFFTADESITVDTPAAISGSWKAAGTATSYNEMVTFAYGSPDVVPGVDLSIYNAAASLSDDQNFVDGEQAFYGSSTVNFSSFTHLPTVGTTGNIMVGFKSSQGDTIGQWQVVPEPASCGLAVIGAAAAFLRRRR